MVFVKLMIDQGFPLDYIMGLDDYEVMIHLGCMLYTSEEGRMSDG